MCKTWQLRALIEPGILGEVKIMNTTSSSERGIQLSGINVSRSVIDPGKLWVVHVSTEGAGAVFTE